MKKIVLILLTVLLSSRLFAFDFTVKLLPAYEFATEKLFNDAGGFSAGLGFDLSPVTLRQRDKLYITGQFASTNFPTDAFGIQSLIDGEVGLGYSVRIMDRFGVTPELYAGLWNYLASDSLGTSSISGIVFGGRVYADYYMSPALTLSAFAGFKSFYTQPKPFINDVQIGLGLKYSLSRGLFAKNYISIEDSQVEPLFPVFYSHYTDNPFGKVTFVNNEENDITDVTVSILLESYMSNPFTVAAIPSVGRGQVFDVDIFAFLNENILGLLQPKNSDFDVTVEYYSLGKKQSVTHTLPVTVLSRNSMTWEDDRRAAAFVSGKDATAQRFARRVKATVKNELRADIPANIQYAAALFGALKAFGINYVVDPSSAFTDNVGTAAVDFLQFPYQTLVYHGGDCDDLTILNCSLLEAIGIKTAFITVPGHIYMAFDSGLSLEEGRKKLGKGYYIEAYDTIWVPLEITLSQDTFGLAWTYGAREWKKAGEEALLIPLSDAWEAYLPISVPGSDTSIDVPSSEEIIKYFKEAKYY